MKIKTILGLHQTYQFLFALIFCAGLKMYGQSTDPSPLSFPTPKNINNMLFYLQRDPNINTLIYVLNIDENGKLNQKEPIHPYWIRYGENSEKKELNYVQRKFGYGLETKKIAADKFELQFVSYKKLPILLQRGKDQKFYATVIINKKKIALNRIFVRIEGGSFWLPNVHYAEIQGVEEATGSNVSERIYI